MKTKMVSDLIPGDVLILKDETRAIVISSRRSGIFETPYGNAFEIEWKNEAGEDGRQLAPPDGEVRVSGT